MALRENLAIVFILFPYGGALACSTYSEDLLEFSTGSADAGAESDLFPAADSDASEDRRTDAGGDDSGGTDRVGSDVATSGADATPEASVSDAARDAFGARDASVPSDAPTQPSTDAEGGESGCASGNAVQLDGATYASVARVVQDDFTIEAWVKMAHSLTGTYFWNGSAIVWADVSTTANDFVVSVVNDRLAIGVGSPDSVAQSTGSAAADKWVHVAATRTRATGTIAVFIDGVTQGSSTGNTSSLNASATMLIGNSGGGLNGFVGELDELRIWNTVRTAAEISSNMTRRLVGNERGLVSYYRFDESSGPTAIDSSPRANHGLFKGPVTWVPSTAPICN
jgi:hypothetical protein